MGKYMYVVIYRQDEFEDPTNVICFDSKQQAEKYIDDETDRNIENYGCFEIDPVKLG